MTTLADTIAATLAEHERIANGGRNLGQYRTEWDCTCGATVTADGHNGPSLREAMLAHLATILAEQETERRDQERVLHGHPSRGGAHS